MKKYLLWTMLLLAVAPSVHGWGGSGHNAAVAIAERNLTPNAKQKIEAYLGGRSIVYYSNWMDRWRHMPPFAETTHWHTAPVDDQYRYTDALKQPDRGNAIWGLEQALKLLADHKNLNDSTVRVNLYYIIHLVPDMHCPSHIQYTTFDVDFQVRMNGRPVQYHSVWDIHVVDNNHTWSYSEWADQLDRATPIEKEQICSGTPRDWFHQSALYCLCIYEMARPDQEIVSPQRTFFNAAEPIVDNQIAKAGYRLAHLLNTLFDQ